MKWLLVAMMVTSMADLATTEYALSQGFEEYNPAMKNRAIRVTAKLVAPVFIYWITGRPELRKRRVFYCLTASALWGAMAGWNIGVMVSW